jgi:hypothetical protein
MFVCRRAKVRAMGSPKSVSRRDTHCSAFVVRVTRETSDRVNIVA